MALEPPDLPPGIIVSLGVFLLSLPMNDTDPDFSSGFRFTGVGSGRLAGVDPHSSRREGTGVAPHVHFRSKSWKNTTSETLFFLHGRKRRFHRRMWMETSAPPSLKGWN